jgi:asparagine synthase (glutamine-hydrolysing)
MCGIAGYKGIGNQKLLDQFSEDLKHRGPDGAGFFVKDNVGILSRRLAIIDRKGGDQPIYNEDKSIVVVYNGELYNYREIRESLEKKGHVFKTKSDTEIIVHLYEEKGEKCFADFNGMFAIALYDIKKKKLLLARDQFGIKPLYFSFPNVTNSVIPSFSQSSDAPVGSPSEGMPPVTLKPNSIIFASEIKPLLHSKLIKTSPNKKILYRYLRYRIHDDLRETFFENIYHLMPGEVMTIDEKETTIARYAPADWAFNEKNADDDYEKGFKDRLYEAIKLRLISEVPVGTSFSGGLDS